MTLYILRHGEAEADAPSDPQRRLTSTGIKESRLMANWLAQQNPQIDLIVASPYTRAQQTAALFKEALQMDDEIKTSKNLTPESDPEELMIEVTAYAANNILLASHMPFVSQLLGFLTDSTHGFPTSGLAKISNKVGGLSHLEWLESPTRRGF